MESQENKQNFLEVARRSIPNLDETLISKAWDTAEKAHFFQKRDTGEPYFTHPIGVATILLDAKCDSATIAATLLHDVVEDTEVTLEQLKDEYGIEIAKLVDGVSKLKSLDIAPHDAWHKEKKRRENLRKLFLSITKDPRVAIIKLGDRLHNLSSLGALDENRRKRIAQESLEVFAPLAEALGLGTIQRRIQDLSFRYLNPTIYHELEEKIKKRGQEFQSAQTTAINIIEDSLQKAGINALVYGRQKEIFSIYRKMFTMSLEFEEVYDIIGIRIIVETEEDCYKVKHTVDQLGVEVKYDDYIVRPRGPLGYQSLHKVITDTDTPGGQLLEIQIRSKEMHERAERGPAAHWIYKLGGGHKLGEDVLKRIRELRDKLDILGEVLEDSDSDLMQSETIGEEIGDELTLSRITVFTPKGDMISLPAKATPLDLAYHIHTDLGHECTGAIVNNHSVPLEHELSDGDTVEIIRKRGSAPKIYWIIEGKVKSTRAKQKIRLYFRKQERPNLIGYGRNVVGKLMNRIKEFDIDLESIIEYFGKSGFWEENASDEFFIAVAEGRISGERIEKVAGKLYIENQLARFGLRRDRVTDIINWSSASEANSPAREDEFALAIIRKEIPTTVIIEAIKAVSAKDLTQEGFSALDFKDEKINRIEFSHGLLAKAAQCCHPLPGDIIKGYVTIGSGISIHNVNCPNIIASRSRDRIVDVDWNIFGMSANSRFSSELLVVLSRADIVDKEI